MVTLNWFPAVLQYCKLSYSIKAALLCVVPVTTTLEAILHIYSDTELTQNFRRISGFILEYLASFTGKSSIHASLSFVIVERVYISGSHLRVSPDIVHINAKQVSQAMRHEDGTNVMLDHVIHSACQDANLHELLQVNPVSQTVHVSPFHTFTKTFHYLQDPCDATV